ncbi:MULTISPECIES: enoyl-CoA hydratase-related protein [Halomonadaceae]|jgi:enoyl-CoA hydratase|uniref:enoyl-CoA hydratase-related protein n=1 Tax=Halomonadaceae TaxID=28256 RepID=UPI0012EFE28D|nr:MULTISPECIES: enoyl-CoA hydratase-related protein [Halomonas]QNU64305.1 enoyl-CoA hydratase/isomerase family protein [Halomonas titanicae]CAD5258837.1 Enoyl-CoA hydratase [Halomonas sp. 59]CAD5259070.1 Enoyl-CoA hydratase [Halomonas sp. 113]CAD5273004.1 Enoyl-CoA hydratase [Halomonas sp. I3]CAD5289604.1 Enoyl-CoA hydratase [Halomonas sp. 156]
MGLDIAFNNGVAEITINCPPVNAITLDIYQQIGEAFEVAETWQNIHCIVFTGAGTRAFCAGLDLNEFLAATIEEDPARARIVRRCFASIREAAIPTIAAVNGPALGAGTVLASVCDIRIAAETARFGMPEINVGRCGGAAHMGRHLPQGMLRKMFFTGEPIDAQEAWRLGFVQEVTSPEDLMETARALAMKIAAKAPLGLRYGKQALNQIEFLPVDEGYAIEQRFSTLLMATEDAREATRSVVEKRKPEFRGR